MAEKLPDGVLESTVDGKYQMYQGKPLLREGSRICYGDASDPYMLLLMIMSSKKVQIGNKIEEVPDNVIVQVIRTDPTLSPVERLEKMIPCKGLVKALNDGIIYMDRMNNK